jgi:hypothetical protein
MRLKHFFCLHQDGRVTVQMNQGEKALSGFVGKATRQNRQLTRIFGSQAA